MRTGQQVAGLATVNSADAGFGVIQSPQEQHFLAERHQGFENFAQLDVLAFSLGPPFAAVKPIPREQAGQPHGRFG